MERFYKLAHLTGWDFYSFDGKTGTINYRENIGKTIRRLRTGKMRLCSDTVIHASRNPNQCFIGAEIPCSAYLVEGKPYIEDDDKCGFKQLKIVKELNPEKLFKWRYTEACNPVHPFKISPPKKITKEHLKLLKSWELVMESVWTSVEASVGDSVWDSVGDSVKDSVGDSIWNSVWRSVEASVGDSVGDSAWASVLDSIWAYAGYIFIPVVKKWKYVEHKQGEYPFQPSVDLWKRGLIPSHDGKKWRLHAYEDARIVWGKKEE